MLTKSHWVCVLALSAGCSAMVSPDTSELEPAAVPGADAGPGIDGGPIPGTDAGPGVDAGSRPDAGPGTDAGPIECDGPPRCEGSTLITCEGGVTHSETCALGCAPGEPRCARFVPSNVPADHWRDDATDVAATEGDVRFDTGECSAEMARSTVVPQERGPELCVLSVRNFTVGAGARLFVGGRRPLVIMATGDVTIAGTIDISARGMASGPGGARGGLRDDGTVDGEGAGGGAAGGHDGFYDDGGGGGGALCGDGGAGGRGGSAAGGAGGSAVAGGWELEPLFGGSGGGRGRGRFVTTSTVTNAGFGGAGGGALQISALGSLSIEAGGAILAGGGGGLGGGNRFTSDVNWGSGGGGGSGGAVLLESVDVRIGGNVNVAGGGGGGSSSGSGDGEDGQDGFEALAARAAGGGGADASRGADGGDSGGGTDPDALPGEDNLTGGANGGGGGGGSGCVLVRTADGTVTGSPAVNPSVPPAYRTARVRVD